MGVVSNNKLYCMVGSLPFHFYEETSGETLITFVSIHWNVSIPIRSFKSHGIVQLDRHESN